MTTWATNKFNSKIQNKNKKEDSENVTINYFKKMCVCLDRTGQAEEEQKNVY